MEISNVKKILSSGLWPLILIALLHLAFQSTRLNEGPQANHAWRQVVGHAAAVNYYEEDLRFFYPRADIRVSQNDTGMIYHEFPITYWLTAQSYRLTGIKNANAHVVALLFNIFLIFGLFYLGKALGYSRRRSLLMSYLGAFAPVYMYYSGTLTPDPLGLTFFIVGLSFLIPSLKQEKFGGPYCLGLFFVLLATLAKPTYLFYGIVLAFLFLYALFYGSRKKIIVAVSALSGILILGVNALVISHAKRLYDASHWLRSVHTPIGAAESPQSWADLTHNLVPAFSKWWLEMQVGYVVLPFFLIAIAVSVKRLGPSTFSSGFWLSWVFSFFVFSIFFVMRFGDHDYYIMSLLPWTVMVGAKGADYLLNTRWKNVALVLLLSVPIYGFGRIYGRWFDPKQRAVPSELLEGDQVSEGIPKTDLVLVSGDHSPIIFLYYLKRKGVSFSTLKASHYSELLSMPFQWIVHYKPDGQLPPFLDEHYVLKLQHESPQFLVYRIESLKT